MKLFNILFIAGSILSAVSCGAPKHMAQKAVTKEVTLPGMHLLTESDVIRAWAVGESTDKMVARNKATLMAQAQLGQLLDMTVNTTVEDYCVTLEDAYQEVSKRYLSEKTQAVSNIVLKGVRIIYDTWDFDKSRNMHLNYVVVEITPNDYLARLAEVIAQDPEVKIDADRLKEMFLKAVNNK
jgi:hypothetical protein